MINKVRVESGQAALRASWPHATLAPKVSDTFSESATRTLPEVNQPCGNNRKAVTV